MKKSTILAPHGVLSDSKEPPSPDGTHKELNWKDVVEKMRGVTLEERISGERVLTDSFRWVQFLGVTLDLKAMLYSLVLEQQFSLEGAELGIQNGLVSS